MVAEREKIDFDDKGGFRTSFVSEVGAMWHFHPEFELVLNLKSSGTRIIGDNIEMFDPYTMTFIAGNIPHSWEHNRHEGNVPPNHSIVCQFNISSIGEELLAQHEMKELRRLFSEAESGISFSEADAREAELHLKKMMSQTGLEKMATFFTVMDILCSSKIKRLLCSSDYKLANDERDDKKMSLAYDYIRTNYSKPITLRKVAALAKMKPPAFSRFFKKNCGAGFTEYINQVRINRVCYLLRETDSLIHEIALECGFQSISNFNKLFRKATSFAPRDYRNGYR